MEKALSESTSLSGDISLKHPRPLPWAYRPRRQTRVPSASSVLLGAIASFSPVLFLLLEVLVLNWATLKWTVQPSMVPEYWNIHSIIITLLIIVVSSGHCLFLLLFLSFSSPSLANQMAASRMHFIQCRWTVRALLHAAQSFVFEQVCLGESLSASPAEAIVCISADESPFWAFTLLYHHSSKALNSKWIKPVCACSIAAVVCTLPVIANRLLAIFLSTGSFLSHPTTRLVHRSHRQFAHDYY